jgi:Flp pilus assembly protein TadG
MIKNLRRNLRRDERGAAIIELAIVAPVLGLMIIGIVDMSNAFSMKLALEQGAQRAIERIEQTTATDTVENTLKSEVVCQVNGTNSDGTCKTSPITTSNVTVTFKLECTDSSGNITTQSNTDPTTFDTYTCASGTVTQAKYLSVQVTENYTPMFSTHFAFINSDGTYHLSATAGMRTS